jgi:hypothetical protein
VHPSGRAYAWETGHEPWSRTLVPFPRWLLAITYARHSHGMAHWRQVAREGIPEGQRNTTLASFTGHLLWHGVDPEVVGSLMLAWNAFHCRPPLPDEEVLRTVESITRLHAHEGEQDE